MSRQPEPGPQHHQPSQLQHPMGLNNTFLLPLGVGGGRFVDVGVGPGASVLEPGPRPRPAPMFTGTTPTPNDCVSSSSSVIIPDSTCSSSAAVVPDTVTSQTQAQPQEVPVQPSQSQSEPQLQSSQRPPLPLHLLQQQLQQSMMTNSTINMMGMDPNISAGGVVPPMLMMNNHHGPLQQQERNWNASSPLPNVNDMTTTKMMMNNGLLLSQQAQSQQRQAQTAALLRLASSPPLNGNNSSCNKGSAPAPEVIFQNRPGWIRQQNRMTSWFGQDCQVMKQNQYISPQYKIQFETLQKATTFCNVLDAIQFTQYQANGCQYIPQPNECLAYYLLNHLNKNLRQIKQMTIEELVKAQQKVYQLLQEQNKLFRTANRITQVKRQKRNQSQPRKPSKTVQKRQQLKQQKQQKIKQEQRLYIHKLNHVRTEQWKATKTKLETASSKEERQKLQKELSDMQKPNWNCPIPTPQQKHYQEVVKPQRLQQRLQRQQQYNTKLY